MKSERKRLYLYAGINFLVGIIMGIVLFYGQIKGFAETFSKDYTYDEKFQLIDLLKVSHLNIMWLLACFMARSILPLAMAHPIMLIRGAASSFSTMYIMTFIGVKEAAISVLPQCFSVIPIMIFFSVYIIEKRRKLDSENKEPSTLCRLDCILIIILGILAAMLEMIIFIALWRLFG